MSRESKKSIEVVNGTITISGFDSTTEIGFDTESKTGNWTYTNLTLDNAKELVRTLVDLIEEREGSPF